MSLDAVQIASIFTDPQLGVRFRQAVVAAVHTGPNSVDLTIAGADEVYPGVRYLASYSPTAADTVWYATDGRDLFVIGKLA